MRVRDGQYECAACGEPLDVQDGQTPTFTMHANSGQPTLRVIRVDGKVIHHCVDRKQDDEPWSAVDDSH